MKDGPNPDQTIVINDDGIDQEIKVIVNGEEFLLSCMYQGKDKIHFSFNPLGKQSITVGGWYSIRVTEDGGHIGYDLPHKHVTNAYGEDQAEFKR